MADSSRRRSSSGPAYPIASVDNALRLLLMFRDPEHQRLRLSDAAASLGVAHSTAHRLLAMLMHHDFVRQEAVRTYVAGPALLDVGLAAVQNMDIRTHAGPVLEELAVATRETVHLAQLEGRRVRYLAHAECPQPLRVAGRTGQMLPANRTATGKALLAELSAERLDQLFPTVDSEDDDGCLTVVARKELDAELALVRERGYATNHARIDDIVSVATAVRNAKGTPVAALNASAPASRMTKRRQLEVVRLLHVAAARLEHLLGASER